MEARISDSIGTFVSGRSATLSYVSNSQQLYGSQGQDQFTNISQQINKGYNLY